MISEWVWLVYSDSVGAGARRSDVKVTQEVQVVVGGVACVKCVGQSL